LERVTETASRKNATNLSNVDGRQERAAFSLYAAPIVGPAAWTPECFLKGIAKDLLRLFR